ncbi:MAG: hypothetical protein IPG83_02040 [Novosphingobium sp.]|nr:hypothetical protein [Novosphingobium sp.]
MTSSSRQQCRDGRLDARDHQGHAAHASNASEQALGNADPAVGDPVQMDQVVGRDLARRGPGGGNLDRRISWVAR